MVWQSRNTLLDLPILPRYRGFSMASPGENSAFLPRPSDPHARRGIDLAQAEKARVSCGPSRGNKQQPPLDEYFNSLFTAMGPQHWWPGKTQFEVIVGAILTQNTSWTNVEPAIANLREQGLLTPREIRRVRLDKLQRLVRSSGYFRQKARKLKAFCDFLQREHRGSLRRMFEMPTITLREELLGVHGIGPETADSILLYAGRHAVFVVDAYTKRILARHGWARENAKYEDIRWMFERQFPGDVKRFNEFQQQHITF